MHFGKTLFSGSKFIFWALSPFLVAFSAFIGWFAYQHPTPEPLMITMFVAFGVGPLLLVLGLYRNVRNRWASRIVTAMVFLLYLAYFLDEVLNSGQPFILFDYSPGHNPWKAFNGLMVIGFPCLVYTIFGKFWEKDEEVDLKTDMEF